MRTTGIVLLLFVCMAAANAYALTIKVGSVAPARSPWDKALKKLDQRWREISKGSVQLKVYPGSIAGSEADVIRKMRIGILSGGGFTNRGLTTLCSDIHIFNIPLLFQSDEEFERVFEAMKQDFEACIREQGFHVVIWNLSGWVKFFSANPVLRPKDLLAHKISFAPNAPVMEQAWKSAGYHLVRNEMKDLMMALQSGMVNAYYLPPLLAASGQYFALTPHMCNIRVAPLVGGIVITDKVWQRVPQQYRQPMMQAAERIAAELYQETVRLEEEAVQEMVKRGLNIHDVPADALKEWRQVADKGIQSLVDKVFSRTLYTRIKDLLTALRSRADDAK